MKKETEKSRDDLRPEYDFLQIKGGVRGKYAARYRAGTNLVRLDSDMARAFPSEKAVNDALRRLIEETAACGFWQKFKEHNNWVKSLVLFIGAGEFGDLAKENRKRRRGATPRGQGQTTLRPSPDPNFKEIS